LTSPVMPTMRLKATRRTSHQPMIRQALRGPTSPKNRDEPRSRFKIAIMIQEAPRPRRSAACRSPSRPGLAPSRTIGLNLPESSAGRHGATYLKDGPRNDPTGHPRPAGEAEAMIAPDSANHEPGKTLPCTDAREASRVASGLPRRSGLIFSRRSSRGLQR